MMGPLEKGNALETAVRLIEDAILKASPALRENTFVIESKKIINAGGVRHEIDVFVSILLAKGYESIYIFECKNWESAVGKNEIVIFSEKIKATQAQRGFIVAKSFTSDAQAQAAKDCRIVLLHASEHDPKGLPLPFDFHVIFNEIAHIGVHFVARKLTSPTITPIDIAATEVMHRGETINLQAYLTSWATEACNESTRTFPSGTLPEGAYDRRAESRREFQEGDFVLDGGEVAHATLSVEFTIRLFRPAVVSCFEVVSRGRTLSLAPVTSGSAQVQMTFVGISELLP